MKINILKEEKNNLEIEISNLTLVELLRNELWKDSSTVVSAWRRENPSENPVLIIKTKEKEAKKVLLSTIARIKQENEELIKEFKKAFK